MDSSIALQYAIELGVAEKIDDPSCLLTKNSKLDELRSRQAAWARLRWTYRSPPISVRNYAAVYELSGGRFFQDINKNVAVSGEMGPSTLAWLRLPSRTNPDVEECAWSQCAYDFKVADVCLDVDRDLIVVVERLDSP